MRKAIVAVSVLLMLMVAQIHSQEESAVPPYLGFDESIVIMNEYLRQDRIDLVGSYRLEPTEYYADVYAPNLNDYFPLGPSGTIMQFPSATAGGTRLYSPDNMYMITIYDFEHDLIIEAGEWKDLNGNFLAEPNEWFDENGNPAREAGEWVDANNNGIVDLGELNDANGNGVFDIGEWHEGKNTDGNPANNLPGEFNGAVDPDEWIGMNRDRSITKKLALKIYKRIYTGNVDYYKEVDYQYYISPSLPVKVYQHPALRAMTTISDNQKLVILLSLDECERCEIVGDVAWYEDEYSRIVLNFKGFSRETLHTTLPRCDGCYEAEITHFVHLQVYYHQKFDLLYENFSLHSMEARGLPDNRDGTAGYYFTGADEREDFVQQLVSFDPYYLMIRGNNELVLYETIYGKALIVPYEKKEEEYSSHIYTRKYPDGTEKDIRVEVVHVYQIETIYCEQIIVVRLLIDEDTQAYNTTNIDPDEKIYTVFYYACTDHFENNIIFPEEYERGLTDFAIIVEKVELENEKVYLKFVREVDSQIIPNPAMFPYGMRDFQVVFDQWDRSKPLGTCDFYPKNERYIPRFEEILVDVCLPFRDLLNNVVLKYEDLKGDPTMVDSYEEQPWEMAEWNTEVTVLQIKKIAYNPNAADYSGFGYGDIPVYFPPLDPAPGLVQVGPDLLPNFQVSDEDFSGTCVPGDTITFYIEVFNGSGGPMAVLVEDTIPAGMFNAAVAAPGVIVDTSGDAIFGNGGDTVVWNIPVLPPGYTLLTYQADVLADGSVNFGGSIINDGAIVFYYEAGMPMSLQAPTVTILVEAAQLIKEAFQDLACTIPAPVILPGSRLYYRLTAFNTIDPLSPIPYTALVTEITDTVPLILTNPQYHVAPPGLAPQPIVANTVSWLGVGTPVVPGASISGIYSAFVPIGAVGRIINDATLRYTVNFPPPGGTSVTTTSNLVETWIQTGLVQIPEPLEPCLEMMVEKDGPTVQAAGNLAYRITVSNSGGGIYGDAFDIVIIDRIPRYTTLIPASIVSSNPNVTWTIHDSDGDGILDTIVWKLNQLTGGDEFTLNFSVTIEDVPYNCYILKVFTRDLYRQEQDRYLGMGGIARSDQFKVTPEDATEVVTDAVFTQVMKGSEKLENYLIKLFESRIYDKKFYFEFADFNEKERSARFRLFTRARPEIDANIYWGILEEIAMGTGSSQIYSDDSFLAHVLLRNDGDGTASQITYELDAPDFQPVDMTWIYNLDQHLYLEMSPDEQAGLLFLMRAPSVSRETTFPVKVRITYSDGLETRTDTKTVYMNVLSQRRANISLKKTILEGKSVVKETGKEVADMRVGEERTIVTFIQNLSENEIKQVHFVDQIPQGLEVIEGHAEWMGTLNPGEVVKVTYKIKVKQIGVYQFRGKIFYKDERDHVYEGVSNITEVRVVTMPGPKLHREVDSSIVTKGDLITVVVRVENDTPNPLEHIQVVDLIPEGFQVEKMETKGLEEVEGTIRYYIDELKPEKYILLKYTLKAGEKAGKYTYKGVRLAYENEDGLKQEVIEEDQVIMIPETESPSLRITPEFRRKVDADGEYITVILEIPNMGGISATNIKVRTTLPEGTQFLEASTDYLQEGESITFLVDEIDVGEQYMLKYTLKIPHFNQDKTYVLTYDALYSDDFEREYSVEKESNLAVKAQKPLIRVTKVVEKNAVKLNFSVRVAINVINEGDIPSTAHVVDPLPEGMVLLSGTNEWEGILEPGESAQILYEMLCTRVGSFTLPRATVAYEDKWKITYTAESEESILTIKGIYVEKAADVSSLKVGEAVVVTVSVVNTYDERATNVVVRDWIPAELSTLEGDTSWSIGVLDPGEEITFTYSLKATAKGNFSLGAAKATFIDVYNDKHESMSESISVSVEEMVPEEEVRPPPTEEIEERVESLREKFAEAFDMALILMIFIVMAFSMVVAFLLIERRRTEEEEYEIEELPPTPEGELIWKKEEISKPVLPSAEERAEEMEEITPFDVLERRKERFEETKEEVGRVAKARDVRELFEKEAGAEEFKFEEEPGEFKFEEELPSRDIEELGLEDLFGEEEPDIKPEAKEPGKTGFTDVREIVRKAREEEENPGRKETELTFPELDYEQEEVEIPDIRELIKGPKKTQDEVEEKDEESDDLDEFNPRNYLKKKD